MAQPKLEKVGKYEIVEVVGRGGMGVVYRAKDPAIGREVAIKMITASYAGDPELLGRFYREARSTGLLQHPNIVTVFDLGDEEGSPYLVMEFLDGEGLDKVITERRHLPLAEKINILTQVGNGLHYAHMRSVVHRDIKPANVVVLSDGTIKIVDFGIARIGSEKHTKTGQIVGSIQYMSPEQLNSAPVDARTDIWAAGVTLFELLAYELPFVGKDTGSTLLRILNDPPPPLSRYLKSYPQDLDEIVQRALAKDPEERYQSAEEFSFDLTRVQEQIKKDMASEYLETAKASMEQGEWAKAREQISQVLRIDRRNVQAGQLLREVQQIIRKKEQGEQARILRESAEEALQHKRLDEALTHLEQAVALVPGDTELAKFCEEVRQKKERAQALHEALGRAQAARQAGALEEAKGALEQALTLDPNDTQARNLQALVEREIQEQRKEQEVSKFVQQARKYISMRRYTTALEILGEAREMDQTSPTVHELIQLASAGREQERLRKEMEGYKNSVEEALNRNDYMEACAKAEEALQKFPGDAELLRLQALAQQQRELGEKRQFVEAHIAQARALLDHAKTDEALAVLQKASTRYPGETNLQALMALVSEELARQQMEKRKEDVVRRAKDALKRKAHDEAIEVLSSARDELGTNDFDALLQFAQTEKTGFEKRQLIDKAAAEAHELLSEDEHERAAQVIEAALEETPDNELEILLAEVRRRAQEFEARVKKAIAAAARLARNEKFDDAVRYLEEQPNTFAKNAEFIVALEKAREEQARARHVAIAVETTRAALKAGEFARAEGVLAQFQETFGDHPKIKIAREELQTRRSEAARRVVEKAIRDARTLLLVRSYDKALEILTSAASAVPDAPEKLRLSYQGLLADVEAGASRELRQETFSGATQGGTSSATQVGQWDEGATVAARPADIQQELRDLLAAIPTMMDTAQVQSMLDHLNSGSFPDSKEARQAAAALAERLKVLQQAASAPTLAPASPAGAPEAVPPPPPAPPQPPPAAAKPPAPPAATPAPAAAPALPPPVTPAAEAPPAPRVPAATPQARPAALTYAGGALGVLVLAVAAYFLLRPGTPAGMELLIRTVPAGAAVSVAGKSCVTPDCALRLPPGEYRVEATLEGHQPAAHVLTITADSPPPPLELTLSPLSTALRISGDLPSGSVSFAGKRLGTLEDGSLSLAEMPPGDGILSVTSAGKEIQFGLRVQPGTLPVVTGPVQTKGTDVIVLANVGARARIYGTSEGSVSWGATSVGKLQADGLAVNAPSEGLHELRVGERQVTATLRPEPAVSVYIDSGRNVATLAIAANVEGATVFLNDKPYSRRLSGGLLRIPLEADEYTVRVERSGYSAAPAQRIRLDRNQETRLSFQLEPLPARLAITGALPRTAVSIDGRQVGTTGPDGRLTAEVPPGERRLELSREGHQPRQLQRRFEPGATLALRGGDVALAPVAAAPPPAVSPATTAAAATPPPAAGQPAASAPPAAAAAPAVSPAARDWERLSTSSNVGELESFARTHAGTPQADLASRRAEQLQFEQARDRREPALLEAYLAKYPRGSYADQARTQLTQLSGQRERDAVLDVLRRYERAYQERDVNQVTTLWPSLSSGDRRKIADFFGFASNVRIEMKPTVGPDVTGDRAVVVAQRTMQFTADGKPQRFQGNVTVRFRKLTDGKWVLESID